ncbi:MAG: O-antigen ligase family protein [Methylocystis sp.]|uniref:O-antigen ligase family protein n=1 Tax=Methylocystis sp. TaxID=1911079 RepID=UPI003DA36BB0
MTATARRAPGGEASRLTFDYERLVGVWVFIFVACGAIGVIEPSPYDFASIVAMALWFFGGFSIHRSFLVFGFLILLFNITGFVALIPYWDNADSALYQYQSGYLVLTGLFYALYMGNRTIARVELCLNAHTAGAVVAAVCGVLGYFDVAGLGNEIFAHAGRASGTFKDPNVLGSYLVLPIVWLSQNLMLGRARSVLLTSATLIVLFLGMFLAFSRGSYGATAVAFLLMIASVYATSSDARMKRRIVVATLAALAMITLLIAVLLLNPETREIFALRTAAVQDYDAGETGRFGNQLRSIPMLLERFMGFGPLRFRLVFDLEPHNSYVGAFANNGWIGGFLFILLVGVSAWIGLRLMFASSPAQRQAQVLAPTLLALFLQGFQIDIDHWRFLFFMLGAVWGLEALRQRDAAAAVTPLSPPAAPASSPAPRRTRDAAPSLQRGSGRYGSASP